jgi:ribonuclease HI
MIIDIFTDGSAINNSRMSKKSKGGIGIYYNYNKQDFFISEPFYIFPITNQRCELFACIRAIQSVIDSLSYNLPKSYKKNFKYIKFGGSNRYDFKNILINDINDIKHFNNLSQNHLIKFFRYNSKPFFKNIKIYKEDKDKKINKISKDKKNITIRILTDSQHLISIMEDWIDLWKIRGWKKADGEEPVNMDLVYWLYKLREEYKDIINIKFKHVKSHMDEPKDKSSELYYYWRGNHIADKLAKIGVK